jgi:hypothetical protein
MSLCGFLKCSRKAAGALFDRTGGHRRDVLLAPGAIHPAAGRLLQNLGEASKGALHPGDGYFKAGYPAR